MYLSLSLFLHNICHDICGSAGVDAQEDTMEASQSMQARPSHDAEPPPEPPSNQALRCYKEGLIDLLRPGESVFDALRRLGNLQVTPPLFILPWPYILKSIL